MRIFAISKDNFKNFSPITTRASYLLPYIIAIYTHMHTHTHTARCKVHPVMQLSLPGALYIHAVALRSQVYTSHTHTRVRATDNMENRRSAVGASIYIRRGSLFRPTWRWTKMCLGIHRPRNVCARSLFSFIGLRLVNIYIYLYQFLVAMGSFVSEQNFNYFLDSFNLFVIL